jgi:hypothetical protein
MRALAPLLLLSACAAAPENEATNEIDARFLNEAEIGAPLNGVTPAPPPRDFNDSRRDTDLERRVRQLETERLVNSR